MSRAKAHIVRLLKQFLREGQETTVRKRLAGTAHQRESCVTQAQSYLNALRLSGEGRAVNSKAVNDVVNECRRLAGSKRINCNVRLRNIEYLLRLAGLCDVKSQGDPTDQYIDRLLKPSAPEPVKVIQTAPPAEPKPMTPDALDFSAVIENARRP